MLSQSVQRERHRARLPGAGKREHRVVGEVPDHALDVAAQAGRVGVLQNRFDRRPLRHELLPPMPSIVAGPVATASARQPGNRKAPALISPNLSPRRSTEMSRGKMKGDDSGNSKRGEARGSGGTTKKS